MKKLLVVVGVLALVGSALADGYRHNKNCNSCNKRCNTCNSCATETEREFIKAEKPKCVKMVPQEHCPKRHVRIVEQESYSCPVDTTTEYNNDMNVRHNNDMNVRD